MCRSIYIKARDWLIWLPWVVSSQDNELEDNMCELFLVVRNTSSPGILWFDGGKGATKAILCFLGRARWPY